MVNVPARPTIASATAPVSRFDVPTKPATNRRRGPLVDLGRRADLLDPAVVEDRQAVAHRERLLLVVGHVDERDADLLLDRLELDLHLLAELEVERAERLVEEQHARPVDERPGERDALALAAGQLARLALLVALEADHPERLGHPRGTLRLGDLADHQPVRDVVADRHVREQGVVLEDRVDVAVERRDRGHVLAVEQDPAGGRQLEAGDHPQGRRLARAGRTEHREELAVGTSRSIPSTATDVAERFVDAPRGGPRPSSRRDGSPSVAIAAVSVGIAKRDLEGWGRDGRRSAARSVRVAALCRARRGRVKDVPGRVPVGAS